MPGTSTTHLLRIARHPPACYLPMSSHTVLVDDSDTDSISYVNIELGPYRGKGWSSLSGPSLDEDTEGPIHNSTLHVATVEDTSVAFPFNGTKALQLHLFEPIERTFNRMPSSFIGTRVAVFGSIRPPTATYALLTLSEYSVLGWDYGGEASMQPFQAPNLTVPRNNVNFFTSNDMPYGSYVLTINVTRASIDAPYYLDYIVIEVPGPAPSTSATATSLLSTASFIPSSQSSRSDGRATALPPLAGFTSTDAALPIGAIVGATVGGVALVAISVLLVACMFKRRHSRRSSDFDYGSVGQQDLPPPITPYVTPPSSCGTREGEDRPSFSRSIPGTAHLELPSTTSVWLPSHKAMAAAFMRPLSNTTTTASNSDGQKNSALFSQYRPSRGESSRASLHEDFAASPLNVAAATGSYAQDHSEESPPAYSPGPA
ncbi:hypothetical protein BV20DRAFT_968229 [Pilatotrama ljubarskyi]|nr:hypothetical protein BV20DRAFT_968229 [Pilatotrama ljubarskyi]